MQLQADDKRVFNEKESEIWMTNPTKNYISRITEQYLHLKGVHKREKMCLVLDVIDRSQMEVR